MGKGGGGGASGFGALFPQPIQADLNFDAEVGDEVPAQETPPWLIPVCRAPAPASLV